MTTLRKMYDTQEDKSGIKRVNTFFVPLEKLYVEVGFNVRDLDDDHICQISQAMELGAYIPPLLVKVTDKGVKIIDGHHRYKAALKVGASRVECKDFEGDEKDMVAAMITSSQGKNLTAIERAKAYQRLKNFGLSPDEIAKKVNRSRPDIDNHLQLMSAPSDVINAVANGDIGLYPAIDAVRRHGNDSGMLVRDAITKAKSEGKKRVVLSKSFAKKDFVSVMEILCKSEISGLPDQLVFLIKKYKGEQ